MAGLLAGCRETAKEELLHQAKALGAEQRWPEARELAKQYLQDHPRDVAGHYLLGQSYLHVPEDYEILGRGELLAAYRLFERSGELGMLVEEMTPEQFKLMYHQETALTYLRSVRRAINYNFPPPAMIAQMREALWHVEEGLKMDGEAHFLLEMKKTLTELLANLEASPDQGGPEPYTPAPIPQHDPQPATGALV